MFNLVKFDYFLTVFSEISRCTMVKKLSPNFYYKKKAAVVSNFCLIGKIHHNFLVPKMIELGRKTFMPIQTLDLRRVSYDGTIILLAYPFHPKILGEQMPILPTCFRRPWLSNQTIKRKTWITLIHDTGANLSSFLTLGGQVVHNAVSAESIFFWNKSYALWPLITVHTGAETIQGRKLFKGGNYSRAETIWGNTVYALIILAI